jgi:hypothetical protein
MSIGCPLVRRLLSQYLDAELSHRRAAQVERHLAACPDCQGELDAYVETVRFMAGGDAPDAPANAWDRMAATLAVRGVPGFAPPGVRPAGASRQVTAPFRIRVMAVAAVLLVAVGLAVSFPRLLQTLGPQQALAHEIDVESFWGGMSDSRVDLGSAFAKAYKLRVVDADQAKRACPAGKGPASELPDGFTLTRSMTIQTDCCPGMALEYRRGDNWLTVVQIASHHPMNWGHLSHETRQIGMMECEIHEERDLCGLVHAGTAVNVFVAGNADPQVLEEVASFLATRAESGAAGSASLNQQ